MYIIDVNDPMYKPIYGVYTQLVSAIYTTLYRPNPDLASSTPSSIINHVSSDVNNNNIIYYQKS